MEPVKDPALSLQWLQLLLWWGFDSWPENFHMLLMLLNQKKRRKKKKRTNEIIGDEDFGVSCSMHARANFFRGGPRPWHTEVPRLGFKLELQLLACTTATATRDPSCICNLHDSSWQCWIPPPTKWGQRSNPPLQWILVGFISAVPQQELSRANCLFNIL